MFEAIPCFDSGRVPLESVQQVRDVTGLPRMKRRSLNTALHRNCTNKEESLEQQVVEKFFMRVQGFCCAGLYYDSCDFRVFKG